MKWIGVSLEVVNTATNVLFNTQTLEIFDPTRSPMRAQSPSCCVTRSITYHLKSALLLSIGFLMKGSESGNHRGSKRLNQPVEGGREEGGERERDREGKEESWESSVACTHLC